MPVDMPPSIVAAKPAAHVRALMTRPPIANPMSPNSRHFKVQFLPDDQVSIPFIKYMRLPTPGWWVTVPGNSGSPNGLGYNFTPQEKFDNKAGLSISCHGRKMGDDNPVIGILKKEPHVLTQAERELLDRTMSKAEKAYTRMLDGRSALVREFFLTSKQHYHVEFNANSNGSTIMVPASITFSATPASYRLCIKRVKASLDTIKWNDIEMSGED